MSFVGLVLRGKGLRLTKMGARVASVASLVGLYLRGKGAHRLHGDSRVSLPAASWSVVSRGIMKHEVFRRFPRHHEMSFRHAIGLHDRSVFVDRSSLVVQSAVHVL